MNFVVQQSKLLAALNHLTPVVPSRTTFTILTNALIEAQENQLRLTATDLDTFISITVPATVTEGGSLTVPAKMMQDLVRELDDEPLTLVTEEEMLKLSYSTGNYSFQGIARTEYPQVDLEPQGEPNFRLQGKDLVGLISSVKFAVSNEDARMILNGVLLKAGDNKILAAATDGHRLGYKSIERVSPECLAEGIVIPSKVLTHMVQLANGSLNEEIDIWVTKRNILLHSKDKVLYSRLVEGVYPAFENVIPKLQPNRLEVDREKFLSLIRRAMVMANTATHQVRLGISNDELSVSSFNPNKGSTAHDHIPCTYQGDTVEISFNARYLMDILREIDSPHVRVTLEGSTQATLFYPVEPAAEDEEFFCLLMPLRL